MGAGSLRVSRAVQKPEFHRWSGRRVPRPEGSLSSQCHWDWGQARAPTAERISSAIVCACETISECEPSTSMVVAFIRLA